MKAKLALATLFLALAALPWIAGCGEPAAGDLRVTHYAKPGCPVCASMRPGVAALAEEFPGKVTAEEVDVTGPEAARMARNLEFRDCGLVVRGRRGEVLWKAGDHQSGISDARDAVRGLLAQPSV